MCLEILSVQDGYTDVRPRLPSGGPDGGRDLQGQYRGELFFGAVGFVNDATNLGRHRSQIERKFFEDLQSALGARGDGGAQPKSFVFFTNVGLTPGIIERLQRNAYSLGLNHCDIFDRERMRIVLDSNRGYAIRFRYLDIPLSDAEQKDFFGAWADAINSLIGSGLREIDKRTKRVQFLLESQLLLDSLAVIVRLDSSVWDACAGRFFFQACVSLRVHSDGLTGVIFGGGTEEIFGPVDGKEARARNTQYGFAFSWLLPGTPQYQRYVEGMESLEHPKNASDEEKLRYIRTFWSSGILEVDRPHLGFRGLSEPFIDRFQPSCKLLDLHGCMIIFESSKELANHIEEIVIVGGGYELLKIPRSGFRLERGGFGRLKVPKEGRQQENSHEWITLRPSELSSCFSIDLMSSTPKRYDW